MVLLSLGRRESEIRRDILQNLTFLPILQDGERRIPHGEEGEGALGMAEGKAVKEGGLEVKEMQKIPVILSASLVRPSFTECLDRGFEIRGENPLF